MAHVLLRTAQLEGDTQSDDQHRVELLPLPGSNELLGYLRDDELERPPNHIGAPQHLRSDLAHHAQGLWASRRIRLQLAASDGRARRLWHQLLRGTVR